MRITKNFYVICTRFRYCKPRITFSTPQLKPFTVKLLIGFGSTNWWFGFMTAERDDEKVTQVGLTATELDLDTTVV